MSLEGIIELFSSSPPSFDFTTEAVPHPAVAFKEELSKAEIQDNLKRYSETPSNSTVDPLDPVHVCSIPGAAITWTIFVASTTSSRIFNTRISATVSRRSGIPSRTISLKGNGDRIYGPFPSSCSRSSLVVVRAWSSCGHGTTPVWHSFSLPLHFLSLPFDRLRHDSFLDILFKFVAYDTDSE